MRLAGFVAALMIGLIAGFFRYLHVYPLTERERWLEVGEWSLITFLCFFLWFRAIAWAFAPKEIEKKSAGNKGVLNAKDLDRIEGELPKEDSVTKESLLKGVGPEQMAELIRRVNKE